MRYRTLGRSGLRVGEIGVGCEGFLEKTPEEVREWIDVCEAAGVNCIDLYAPNPDFRSNLGLALRGRREKFVLQAQLCTIWKDGQYKRTRDINQVREGFEDQLQRLGTDHVEIGMVHYVDSLADWEAVKNGSVMEYAQELRTAGTIGCVGLSSHNPQAAQAAVNSGLIDVLMFSVNPCYDLQPASEDVEELWAPKNYAPFEHGPGAPGPLRDLPAAGDRDHRHEGLRRRGPAQRQALPGGKGPDGLPVPPVRPGPARRRLRHVRRPEPGGFEAEPCF